MNVDDTELLRLSSSGDVGAFEKFLERHKDSVMGFLTSLAGGSENAADAFQETFISAWQSAGDFRAEGAARSWLFSIARRTLIRMERRRSGEPRELESIDDLALRAGWRSQDNPSDFLDLLADRDLIENAMKNLNPAEREVLILRDVHGLSGNEVANILGLSPAAMKSRLHRARLLYVANLRQVTDGDQ